MGDMMGILEKLFGMTQDNKNAHNSRFAVAAKERIRPENIGSIKNRYIAFDVETTGLSPMDDRIVELGAVVFENGVIVNSFSTLVNPGRPIPASATKINHITNEMLRTAPGEKSVYPALVNFLGDAINGATMICAHNARFDMEFLCETFNRLGIGACIRYIDTLSLSRDILKLENYKQETVAKAMGITNRDAHRAVTDAEVCGLILWNLINNSGKIADNDSYKNAPKEFLDEELEICAFIQNAIVRRGGQEHSIGFYKNSNGYVDVCNLNSFLKFKFAQKGKYIVVPADITTPKALPTEQCSVYEGGTVNKRLFFSSPKNLDFLGDYFYAAYQTSEVAKMNYINCSIEARKEAEKIIFGMRHLSNTDVHEIIEKNKKKTFSAVPENVSIKRKIEREEVTVNANNSRCPLNMIRNFGDSSKGFEAGYSFFDQGEALRKQGEITKAIGLFDYARANGYDAPALYEAYAKAYRSIKDYENEIVIIEEYIDRNPGITNGELEARRDRAIELLYSKQQEEKSRHDVIVPKDTVTNEKNSSGDSGSKGQQVNVNEKKACGKRAIRQMDDAGNIIKEYDSIASASREAGVSEKSIRTAANGGQKHAGGFAWEYID